jgi:hypothetical protein
MAPAIRRPSLTISSAALAMTHDPRRIDRGRRAAASLHAIGVAGEPGAAQ